MLGTGFGIRVAVALLLYFSLVTAFVSGCSVRHSRTDLVGKWTTTTSDGSVCRLLFESKGTFSGTIRSDKGELVSNFHGTWRLVGGRLEYHYQKDSSGLIPEGATDEDALLELNARRLTVRASDGVVVTYSRDVP